MELSDIFTTRQAEIFMMVIGDMTNRQIAEKLGISQRTVECHREYIREKTGTVRSVALYIWAIENGIIKAPKRKRRK